MSSPISKHTRIADSKIYPGSCRERRSILSFSRLIVAGQNSFSHDRPERVYNTRPTRLLRGDGHFRCAHSSRVITTSRRSRDSLVAMGPIVSPQKRSDLFCHANSTLDRVCLRCYSIIASYGVSGSCQCLALAKILFSEL